MARFKKGSAAAKAWGRKMARARGKTLTKSRSRKKVVRRRTARKKTRRSTRSKTMKFMGLNLGLIGAGVAYGAIREYASNKLMPFTQKIPLGAVSDEVGLLIATMAAKKYVFKGKGFMRNVLTQGQTIEAVRIGQAAINGDINLGGLNASSTPSGKLF